MIRSKDDKIFEIVCIVLASLFMLVCLYPLLYSLGISLCGEAEWTEKNGLILPLSTPVVASIGLFTMVAHWNNWFDVMIYIDQAHSALWTLQYYIMINFNNLAQIDSSVIEITGGGVTQETLRMALTITGFLPILCIYPFFQKFFKDGVYLGAVKG